VLQLKPFQKQAIDTFAPLPPHSVHLICTAPTGSGKSLIYEEVALQGERRTVLITPLVALARQQAEGFRRRRAQAPFGFEVALGIRGSSDPPPSSRSGVWILSPESLLSSARQQALRKWKPNFLVVDECHCLWEWGESFRPAFARIPQLLHELGISQSLWLTATLTPGARQDLKDQLPAPVVELGGFALPPRLDLDWVQAPYSKRPALVYSWLRQQLRVPASGGGVSEEAQVGLLFVQTREEVSRWMRLVSAWGFLGIPYHGGLAEEERRAIEAFLSEPKTPGAPSSLRQKGLPFAELAAVHGRAARILVVATSAFGMGMNYPQLRWVVLTHAPLSLLALVQALGRVGRHPEQSGRGLILWDESDWRRVESWVSSSVRAQQELRAVHSFFLQEGCHRQFLLNYFNSSGIIPAVNSRVGGNVGKGFVPLPSVQRGPTPA
jgi:ATP-dependent DNA helicase RecQ